MTQLETKSLASNVMKESDLPHLLRRGKVRDTHEIYPLGSPDGDYLLVVATDRISAYDVVLPTEIPFKGVVLSRLAAWWFQRISEVIPNHFVTLLTADTLHIVKERDPELAVHLDDRYFWRSMLVRRAKPILAECIARGYLSGSGWKEYRSTGKISGIQFPSGLRDSDRLPEPIFTPSTKADIGQHDVNITYAELEAIVGEETAQILKTRTLAVYDYGQKVALERGIIIADTKFEFGLRNDEVILIDEILTPDSSRFWPVDSYRPGGLQVSFDKQPVRDWLMKSGWKDGCEPPEIPSDIVQATTERYLKAYEMLTGEKLPAE